MNELIVRNLGLVHALAIKKSKHVPQCIEEGELVSAGVDGLRQAILKFDPTRGIQFASYASRRIVGSMQDWMRSLDWVPRQARVKGNTLAQLQCSQLDDQRERGHWIDDIADEAEPATVGVGDRDTFRELIRALPRVKQIVLVGLYCDGLNMREVGEVLGKTESRISQIHREAIVEMKLHAHELPWSNEDDERFGIALKVSA